MRYEMMLPYQIRTAIERRWPVVLPLGVLEYHGEHMAVGMDTLAVTRTLKLLEREIDLVILPPLLLWRRQPCRGAAGGKRNAARGRRGTRAIREGTVHWAVYDLTT